MADIMPPQSVTFSIPYSDGSRNKVAVTYDETSDYHRGYVVIEAVEDIRVELGDLDWLIDALRSVQRICDARPTTTKDSNHG